MFERLPCHLLCKRRGEDIEEGRKGEEMEIGIYVILAEKHPPIKEISGIIFTQFMFIQALRNKLEEAVLFIDYQISNVKYQFRVAECAARVLKMKER